jgi:hypothetical protein
VTEFRVMRLDCTRADFNRNEGVNPNRVPEGRNNLARQRAPYNRFTSASASVSARSKLSPNTSNARAFSVVAQFTAVMVRTANTEKHTPRMQTLVPKHREAYACKHWFQSTEKHTHTNIGSTACYWSHACWLHASNRAI